MSNLANQKKSFIGINSKNICLLKSFRLYAFFSKRKTLYAFNSENISKNVINVEMPDERDSLYEFNDQVYEFIENFKGLYEIRNFKIVRYLNKIYRTSKFESFFSSELSRLAFYSLVEAHNIKKQYPEINIILPKTSFFKLFSRAILKENYKVKYSTWLTIFISFFSVIEILKSSFATVRVKPVIRAKEKGLILRELMRGFKARASFPDNIFVDKKYIHENDIVYYSARNSMKNFFKEAKEKKVKMLDFRDNPRMFNFNRLFFYNIIFNFFLPFYYLFLSIKKIDLFLYLPKIIRCSTSIHKLISFADVKWNFSNRDWGDQIETIVFNRHGIKNFVYHWSDYTFGRWFDQQNLCHNMVFSWGNIMHKYAWLHSNIDSIKDVGCPQKMQIDKQAKKIEYNLEQYKQIITFYDTSFGPWALFTREEMLSFYETIKFIDSHLDPNITILIKPKSRIILERLKKNLPNFSKRVISIDPVKYPSIDVIKLSDVNIGCGPNSTTTISLINNIPGIYYDVTGNTIHPMTKYEGDIFVRNKESLLRRIRYYLNFSGDIKKEFPLIEEYDVSDTVDPIKVISKFLFINKDINIKNLKNN